MFDLIIIGASAAGCNAAIYAARRNLKFKIITDNIGGEVALSGQVNNWLGIIDIQGFELAQKFYEHVKSYNVEIDQGWRVASVIAEHNYFIITANNASGAENKYQTKAVIIASGIHPRRLNVPNEKELDRKGVTYCTVCDGPLFKNKITATIGAGNAALESALMMSGIAKKVYLLTKFDNSSENNFGFPKGENVLVDKVKSLSNVEIIYSATTTAIIGEKKVSGLTYKNKDNEEKNISVEGVMVHVGQLPNSHFIESVEKTKSGEIIVNAKCATSILGIFAAGDVTNIPYKQIGIAAGQGIVAVLAAIEYINRWKELV